MGASRREKTSTPRGNPTLKFHHVLSTGLFVWVGIFSHGIKTKTVSAKRHPTLQKDLIECVPPIKQPRHCWEAYVIDTPFSGKPKAKGLQRWLERRKSGLRRSRIAREQLKKKHNIVKEVDFSGLRSSGIPTRKKQYQQNNTWFEGVRQKQAPLRENQRRKHTKLFGKAYLSVLGCCRHSDRKSS